MRKAPRFEFLLRGQLVNTQEEFAHPQAPPTLRVLDRFDHQHLRVG